MTDTEKRPTGRELSIGRGRPSLPLDALAVRLFEILQDGGAADGALEEARALSADLRDALPTRFTIERAKGVVMGATGCGAEEAFQHLRTLSQRQNRPLRDLAEEIATTGRLPSS